MASTIRAAMATLLDSYREADGYAPDEYHPEPLQHPMAEGKYLLACSEAHASGLMRDAELQARAREGYERLAGRKVETDTGIGWGLGFAWKDTQPDSTYAITTAITLHGLHTVSRRTPHLVPDGWAELVCGAT